MTATAVAGAPESSSFVYIAGAFLSGSGLAAVGQLLRRRSENEVDHIGIARGLMSELRTDVDRARADAKTAIGRADAAEKKLELVQTKLEHAEKDRLKLRSRAENAERREAIWRGRAQRAEARLAETT